MVHQNKIIQQKLVKVIQKYDQMFQDLNEQLLAVSEDDPKFNEIIKQWEEMDEDYEEAKLKLEELKINRRKCKNKIERYKKGCNP